MGLKPIRIYYGRLIVAASSGIGFANAATAIGILTIFVIPMSQEFGWSRNQVAGFAVGPLASGIVYDPTGSYQKAFNYFALLALVSSALVSSALVSSALILAARPPTQWEPP